MYVRVNAFFFFYQLNNEKPRIKYIHSWNLKKHDTTLTPQLFSALEIWAL